MRTVVIRADSIGVSGAAGSAAAPLVEVAGDEDGAAWDAYVETRTDATIHDLFGWKIVAEQAYGLRAPFLVARGTPKGPIRGVLPLVHIPRPFNPYLSTGLFGAYGPLLADQERYARALVGAATKFVDEGEARHLHMRLTGSAPAGLGLDRQDVWVTAKLDLGTDEEALWRSLSRKRRGQIRRARKAGLEPWRGHDQFDGFYRVLFENMHRKGVPMYGRSFFRSALRAFAPRIDIITLRDRGRVVSGALVASLHGTLYVPFASSRADYFRLYVNNLLYWEIMRHALELGCRTLDFGSSLRGSTGLHFKVGWHPRIEPIGSYVYAAPGLRPKLDPREIEVAAIAVEVLARVPRVVAHVLGPALCRWIA